MLYAVPEKGRKITSVERKDNRLYLVSEAGIHRLEPKTAKIVRVTYTQNTDFAQEEKPGVIHKEIYSDWEYVENEKEIIFSTESLKIVIGREYATFTYFSKEGELLFKEYNKTLEEFTTYKVLEEELQVEKVVTADGTKDVVRKADRVPVGKSYHTKMNIEWDTQEAVYGLGQHEEGFASLRGQTIYVHQANRKIAIPMFVSTKGYGILVDTYSPLIFSDTIYGAYIYTEADAELDYYFIFGQSMDGVVAGYRTLTGKVSLLPKWAFGYLQSQERYETQQEILEVAEAYRERGIGLDGIVLDWCSWEGYQWGQKTFDKNRFPNPKEMIDTLHENHVHFMLSIWPNMDEHTENYKEFAEKGLLLPGCNVYNALSKEARSVYWKQVESGLFCHGIDAWWCDNSEPYTPEWNHKGMAEPAKMYQEYCQTAEIHLPVEQMNVYALYHAQALYEGQREKSVKRVVNLTRSAYTGQQRYGTIMWSGDIAASWDTLRKQIAAGLHFSASGMPFWTVDIGAFFVKRGDVWFWKGEYDQTTQDLGYRELFVRWYQWATFLPVFRGHGTDCRRELWNIANEDVPFYDALLQMNQLRYELMPYIYSYAGKCWLEDGSMMKLLAFAYPHDREVWNIVDQYMFGDQLMICPVLNPMYYDCGSVKLQNVEKTRRVYLPEGNAWFDYWTNTCYEGGQWIVVQAPIERIPIFVKEGSMIPRVEAGLSTEELSREVSVGIYAGKDAGFTLYEDAGDEYAYENGEYGLAEIRWQDAEQIFEIVSNNTAYIVKQVTVIAKDGTVSVRTDL